MFRKSIDILATVVLVTLLLLQMQGRWVIFKLQQTAIRHEVKQQIKAGVPEEDLVTLKIAKLWEAEPNNRFEREHSREFRFDGEMYDIVRTEDRGDTTVYLCIHDVKESGLFAELEEMIEEEIKHPMNEGNRKQIEDWVCTNYHLAAAFSIDHVSKSADLDQWVSESYNSQSQKVNSPPPDQIG
ncbi:MAG: hypothetical protein R2813_05820 [Flavobacteriales bacterium]